MSSSGLKYRQNCLCSGYIKEELLHRDGKDLYPLELSSVINDFLGNMLLGFDCAHKEELFKDIDGNGKHIKICFKSASIDERVAHTKIACSSFINKGVTVIDIKCIQSSRWDAIGIMSDIDQYKSDEWLSQIKGYRYWYYDGQGIFAHHNDKKSSLDKQYDKLPKWKQDDIISMKIDCNEWNITFYLNEEEKQKHDLQPNLKYYLVLQAFNCYCDNEYKIL